MRGKGIGSTIRDNQNKTQSAQSSAQNKHCVSSGNQYENVSGTAEDLQSQGTQFPLKYPALNHGDLDGSRVIDVDLTRARSHVTRFRLTGGPQTVTFSKPPAIIEGMLIFFEITQDGVGGHAVNWPLGLLPTPILNSTPNAKTLIAMFSTDQGTTWHTQVFGATEGGSGGEVFAWSASHSAETFDLNNLNKIHFDSILNSLSIARGGGSSFTSLDYEAINEHQFFVKKSVNPNPRFSILENDAQSNVKLVMNNKDIEDTKSIQFGSIGSVLPSQKEIVGTPDSLVMNITQNKELRVVAGGDPSDILLRIDDLTKELTTEGLDIVMNSGKNLKIRDVDPSRSLQLYPAFGEQNISASNSLHLQVGFVDLMELDTKIKGKADYDAGNNDFLNIKTLQVKELFPAGTAPPGITDTAILFCRPSGSGKTELRVKFQSGNSILIAEES